MENINTVQRNIYTASATIHRLNSLGYTDKEIISKTILTEEDYVQILKGYRPFTKEEYISIITVFPIMECCIEYFETVRRK